MNDITLGSERLLLSGLSVYSAPLNSSQYVKTAHWKIMQVLEGELDLFLYLSVNIYLFLSNATKTNMFCQAVGLQALLRPTKACSAQATCKQADPFYMHTK